MLKLLSSLNYEMFCKSLNNESVSKLRIDFNSLQEELFDRLLGEFISPIEREDIFILQKRLEEEFFEICSFSLFKTDNRYISLLCVEELKELLKDNISVFLELKNFKIPKKLLRLTKENKKRAINLSLSIKRNSLELKEFKELAEALQQIANLVFLIDTEIERIVLNNN